MPEIRMPQTYEDCVVWLTLFLRTRTVVARFYEHADRRDAELMLSAQRYQRYQIAPVPWPDIAVRGPVQRLELFE
jgi:hypothetical protein